MKKSFLRMSLIAGVLATAFAQPALAQNKTLTIAMTAADIPRTLGQPDQGFEGNRFTGIPMYDALTQWDLTKTDAASVVIPGVALSWADVTTVMVEGRPLRTRRMRSSHWPSSQHRTMLFSAKKIEATHSWDWVWL